MDSFYSRFFPSAERNAMKGYHAELKALLGKKDRLLDLGCGDNSRLARYDTRHRRVWGVDVERHPRLKNTERFRLLDQNGRIPFPDETFDIVTSSWVLEHVSEPARFLDEVTRVLKPGGRFVALTVNGHHYVTWVTRLFDLLPHYVTRELVWRLYQRPHEDTFPTCFLMNTHRRLMLSAQDAGLELEATKRFANPDYFRFFRPLMRAAILTDWCLERVRPGLGKLYLLATLRKPIKSPMMPRDISNPIHAA